jgi:prephenate dehydratase
MNATYNETAYLADAARTRQVIQAAGYDSVATLGPSGSNCDAVVRAIGTAESSLHGSLLEAMAAIYTYDPTDAWGPQVAMIPLHNRLAGEIKHTSTYDETTMGMIQDAGGRVLTMLGVPIEHCLLARQPTMPRHKPTVYSHPQALAQCSWYLEQAGLVGLEEAASTSDAAEQLQRGDLGNALVIANRLAASEYGLYIVEENIGNAPPDVNVTTMGIVAP